MQNFIRTLLVITAMEALAMTSSAVVLDWTQPANTWTAGTLSSSYDIDPSNAGNDITITIAYNGAAQTAGYPVNTVTGASVIGSNDASRLQVRTTGMGNATNNVTFTITFNYAAGVKDASFTLIDVDATTATWIDAFNAINATPVTGSPNSVALTATSANTANTTVTGSGTTGMTVVALTAAGNITDHSGDVTFATDATPITSLTFSWNNPGPNFGGQVIGISNISFTPVPEIGSSFGALATCGGLLAAWRRRPARRGLAAA